MRALTVPTAAPHELGKDVRHIVRVRLTSAIGVSGGLGIVAVILLLGAFLTRGVDLTPVVLPPLFRVFQQVIGSGSGLELGFGLGVTGFQVGVTFLGDAPIGLFDLGIAGVFGDTKGGIGIVAHLTSRRSG